MVTWVGKARVNQSKMTAKNDELAKNRNKWLCCKNKGAKLEWYFFRIFLKRLRCPGTRPAVAPMFF
jgi:hypothetical protein